jgi:hypothetical protein
MQMAWLELLQLAGASLAIGLGRVTTSSCSASDLEPGPTLCPASCQHCQQQHVEDPCIRQRFRQTWQTWRLTWSTGPLRTHMPQLAAPLHTSTRTRHLHRCCMHARRVRLLPLTCCTPCDKDTRFHTPAAPQVRRQQHCRLCTAAALHNLPSGATCPIVLWTQCQSSRHLPAGNAHGAARLS